MNTQMSSPDAFKLMMQAASRLQHDQKATNETASRRSNIHPSPQHKRQRIGTSSSSGGAVDLVHSQPSHGHIRSTPAAGVCMISAESMSLRSQRSPHAASCIAEGALGTPGPSSHTTTKPAGQEAAFYASIQDVPHSEGELPSAVASDPAATVHALVSSPLAAGRQQQSMSARDKAHHHAAAVAAFKGVFQSRKFAPAPQKYNYLVVYDMEATCNQSRSLHPVEIIELSCVIIDTKAAQTTGSFQAYVKPTEHPQLDPYCIDLTGIKQHQIDTAEHLQSVLQHHHKWLEKQGMFAPGVKFLAVTWTDWDLAICLCTECAWRRIQRPDYLRSWVDLKRQFYAKYKQRGNLRTCVEAAGLQWQGRAHSGLDDATNTAQLAIKLMLQGIVFEATQTSEDKPIVPAAETTQAGSASQAALIRNGSSNRARAAIAANRGGPIMCSCGVKAQLRTTKRPGPNHGRQFYSCGTWTITRQQSRGCGFFVWTDELHGA